MAGSRGKDTADGAFRSRFYEKYHTVHAWRWGPASASRVAQQTRTLKARFSRLLPEDRGARCLDVGCGDGPFLRLLGELGYDQVAGVDLSGEQVELARLVCPSVYQDDAVSFLSRQGGWDFISALSLLEHFTRSEAMAFLDASYQALNPGGTMVILTPNAQSPFACQMRYLDPTHEWIHGPAGLTSMLSLCGFRDCRVFSIAPHVHGPVSLVRRIAWQLIVAMITAYWLVEGGTTGGCIFSREMIATAMKPEAGGAGQ